MFISNKSSHSGQEKQTFTGSKSVSGNRSHPSAKKYFLLPKGKLRSTTSTHDEAINLTHIVAAQCALENTRSARASHLETLHVGDSLNLTRSEPAKLFRHSASIESRTLSDLLSLRSTRPSIPQKPWSNFPLGAPKESHRGPPGYTHLD